MNTILKWCGIALCTAILFDACTVTHPIRQTKMKTDFFSPVRARAHTTQPQKQEFDSNLAMKLAEVRDSLASVMEMVQYLRSRLASIETYQAGFAAKQSSLEHQLEYAQSENRRLSQELSELRSKSFTYREPMPQAGAMIPARHSSVNVTMEYEDALDLFMTRQYQKAIESFQNLLSANVPDDLADNCEYWTGESYFAKKDYGRAIKSFEKVISWSTSNKQADAYFMLGRSYEALRDTAKARWAYEELLKRFPQSERSILARQKLRQMQIRSIVPPSHQSKKTAPPTI